jgi:hypothetical protein
MNSRSSASFLLPVVLAGVGIAALATAIILVPSMAHKYAEGRPCPGAAAPTAPASPPPPVEAARQEAPVARDAPTAVSSPPPAPPEPQEAPAQTPAAAPPGSAWSIEMDPGDYALLGDGEAVIDAIVLVLARNPDAVVSLTGVNSPNKSSKRAKRAAEVVKEKIVADVGVSARQVQTSGAQDPTVDGLIVRAELVGGGR